jgi:hypothetical protein
VSGSGSLDGPVCVHQWSLFNPLRCSDCAADEKRRQTTKPIGSEPSFPDAISNTPALARERISPLLDANNRYVEENRVLKAENATLKDRLHKGLTGLLDAVAARYVRPS